MPGNHLHEWLTLNMMPGLGSTAIRRLVEHFGDPARVLAADRQALAGVQGLRRDALDSFSAENLRTAAAEATTELEALQKTDIAVITFADARYPELLRKIHNPPVLLYVKGEPELLDCAGLAIVGSRAATSYGRRVAARMAFELSRKGLTIISGLALGIDTEAHLGALAAGGPTIAVLGCGLDLVYPQDNRELFENISRAGALVSEYPLGTKPDAFRFPARNRIISGLSLGVVIVEAARQSGSLITAEHALEQGREVFAVPGQVDSVKSTGTHKLLQQGAKLVMNINDIFEELPLLPLATKSEAPVLPGRKAAARPAIAALLPAEKKILSLLEVYPKNIDEIVVSTGFPAQQVNELLLLLELKGLVEALPGKCYRRETLGLAKKDKKKQ